VICSVVLSPLLIVRVRSRASWWGDPRTGVTRGLVEHVKLRLAEMSFGMNTFGQCKTDRGCLIN
jgi:hypothetical protein